MAEPKNEQHGSQLQYNNVQKSFRICKVEICPRSESAISWKVAARQDPGYCEQILQSLICWLSQGKSVAQGKENCQLASEHKKTRDQPDMRYPKGDSNIWGWVEGRSDEKKVCRAPVSGEGGVDLI